MLLAALLIALTLPVVAQTPLKPDRCRIKGTDDRDIIAGTREADVICAKAGDDYAHGNGGEDIIRGGLGDDALIGGLGADLLRGRAGDDRLFVVDGHPGDIASGGDGTDECFADMGDVVRKCETIRIGETLRTVDALSDALYGTMALANESPDCPPDSC
jgi:hypothetical protein